MTATPLEFLPPRSLPSPDWVAELAQMLDGRGDVVAAYYVTTRYLEPPEALQDELHIELGNPPGEGGAPAELFRELAYELPSVREGVIFTFGTSETLPRVREAGALLWARDGERS